MSRVLRSSVDEPLLVDRGLAAVEGVTDRSSSARRSTTPPPTRPCSICYPGSLELAAIYKVWIAVDDLLKSMDPKLDFDDRRCLLANMKSRG
jgi:hypothetical protein